MMINFVRIPVILTVVEWSYRKQKRLLMNEKERNKKSVWQSRSPEMYHTCVLYDNYVLNNDCSVIILSFCAIYSKFWCTV